MRNKYFLDSEKDLIKNHNINVVDEIILSNKERVILFADITDKNLEMKVISGSLDVFGLEDTKSISLYTFIDYLDMNNKYAEVSGRIEYKATIEKDIFDFDTNTNVTIPLLVNDKRVWVRIHIVMVESNKKIRAFHITDVTQYRVEEEDIFDKTHKDSLTNLFNKYTLDYHYGSRYNFENFHVMYFDLDDFKIINDKCGHITGNDFLKEFANILKTHEDNYDRFYRIGGDEFVGLIFRDKHDVLELAADILIKTTKYKHPDCKHSTSVSIGICKATTREDVIRKADKVLYEVKNSGKNNYKYIVEDEI